nr:hypothetical protein [Enterobacter asburiae]
MINMNIKMTKLIIAGVMAGLSAPALSDAFSDRINADVSLEFTRDINSVTLTLEQITGLYASVTMEAGTKVATLRASSERDEKIGFRWLQSPSQGVNRNVVTVKNKTQPKKTLKLMLNIYDLTATVLGTETFYVSGQKGPVEADISLAAAQEIEPGVYPVSIQAAVYND